MSGESGGESLWARLNKPIGSGGKKKTGRTGAATGAGAGQYPAAPGSVA